MFSNTDEIIFLLYRVKIVKENALPDIENYMFEQHEQIRQAATECMCNLVTCKEVSIFKLLKTSINVAHVQFAEDMNRCGLKVQQRYLDDGNDKLKLLVLLCGEDDDNLQIAAAGALAMLTVAQKKLCTKMTQVVSPSILDCTVIRGTQWFSGTFGIDCLIPPFFPRLYSGWRSCSVCVFTTTPGCSIEA